MNQTAVESFNYNLPTYLSNKTASCYKVYPLFLLNVIPPRASPRDQEAADHRELPTTGETAEERLGTRAREKKRDL